MDATEATMATTFTIKQVPDEVADALRTRAARNRRSLQRELLLVMEEAARDVGDASRAAEPARVYASDPGNDTGRNVKRARRASGRSRLTLAELWERSRALGPSSPAESAAIVRRDRDERNGH